MNNDVYPCRMQVILSIPTLFNILSLSSPVSLPQIMPAGLFAQLLERAGYIDVCLVCRMASLQPLA